jgi:HD-like signal output (HDOD) protein/CheY-like chemotaxis protein
MSSILVVDDMALFRSSLATVLRTAGYTTHCAKDGADGIRQVRAYRPDLVLLDLLMPVMDGLSFLRVLRRDTALAGTIVILLTEAMEKKYVLEAAKLGARDYLLKSMISADELVDRIKRHLAVKPAPEAPATQHATSSGKPEIQATVVRIDTVVEAPSVQLLPSGTPQNTAPLLNKQQCVQRVEACMAGKTLSGAVAEVMMLASRPSAELKDLSSLITRDSVLSVRVLQMANSAAFFTRRGAVSTVSEAVRNIGATNVRNIAASVGVFDAMPASSPDGFNPIRCWQHSFAVARLCEAFVAPVSPDEAGVGYLVGLCHDLGEIMFRTQFENEYKSVLDQHSQSGEPLEDIELRLLGMTRTEILKVILKCMGLPETIRNPIERFQRVGKVVASQPLVLCALALSETYANGLLLASSGLSLVSPFTERDLSAFAGQTKLQIPDADEVRAQVYCLTAILSRMNAAEQATLLKSPFQKTDTHVWLARDPQFSSIDPLAIALGELADVQVHDHLPTPAESTNVSCLVLEGLTRNTPGWSQPDIEKVRTAIPHLPVLWFVNEPIAQPGTGPDIPMNVASIQMIVDTIGEVVSPAM